MKWGIISDTHNKAQIVESAIDIFRKEHCCRVFHCGDFEDESIFNMFCGKTFNFHYVTDHSSHDAGLSNSRELFDEEIDGFTVGMMHNTYDKVKINNQDYKIEDLISSNYFDYFFYGHLHYLNVKLEDDDNKTIAINPGAFYLSYWKSTLYTFCILDPSTKKMEVYYYHNDRFKTIFRIFLDRPVNKCIMYYSGTPLNNYFKAFNYYKNKLNIGYYCFSHFADHLWLNKNLEVFEKMYT